MIITCYKCGSKNEIEQEKLKYSPSMSPYVCPVCEAGIELGSISKLEKFILSKFKVEQSTIVDFIIEKLEDVKEKEIC